MTGLCCFQNLLELSFRLSCHSFDIHACLVWKKLVPKSIDKTQKDVIFCDKISLTVNFEKKCFSSAWSNISRNHTLPGLFWWSFVCSNESFLFKPLNGSFVIALGFLQGGSTFGHRSTRLFSQPFDRFDWDFDAGEVGLECSGQH